MKRKLTAIGICMALILCMLPATALAAPAYNDHDYNALKTFLNLTSANGVDTNGVAAFGSGYSDADPSTWTGVTWEDYGGELFVQSIMWRDCSLNGNLDLSNCTRLESIDVISFNDTSPNSIDSFNFSGCSLLMGIWCWHNSMTALDLSGLANLQVVDCSYCENLTSLTLTGSSGIEGLYCDECPLGTLPLSAVPLLRDLSCSNCGLTSLDLSGNPGMRSVWCEDNDFTSIDVTGLSNLTDLIMGGSTSLGSIDISDLTSLVQLSCWDCGLTSLELPGTSLEYLSCSENSITSLDVSGQTVLEDLYCEDNSLTELDVSDCVGLWSFNCSANSILSLDVSHSPLLEELYCSENQLASLDVSHNPQLQELYCGGNQLTSLDVSHNTLLERLNCEDNLLTTLDTTDCTSLQRMWCTGNRLVSVDAVLEGSSIKLAANGSGYVGLTYDPRGGEYYITATENTGTFMDWTNAADAQVSTMAQTDILRATAYDLTADFLTIESSVSGGKIYVGGRITLTPNFDGGEWDWDEDYFSATFNSPATFTALKVGTTTVTYTVGGVTVSYDVTIEASGLPGTGQDFTWVWMLCGAALILAAGAAVLKRKAMKS